MHRVIGNSYPIKDAILKVTGQKIFTDDMKLPHMLYGKIKYCTVPHAKIKKIDIKKAAQLEGVHAIITYENTPSVLYNSALRFYDHDIPFTESLFPRNVRFVGDRVAAVAAETSEIAKKAVELIEVSYEELPSYFSVEEAADPNAFPIHENGNTLNEIKSSAGDVDQAFEKADFIFEDAFDVHPVNHAAIELHCSIADYKMDDKLIVYTSCQNVFAFRVILSQIMDLPLHKIRVITPAIGGSFGGKLEMTIEPIASILSKMTRRPVKIQMSREEVFISTRTRHGALTHIKTAVMEDGTIIGQDIQMLLNAGAYAASAYNVLGALSHKIFKVYQIPNMRFSGKPVYTNLPIAGAMRGYGSPQIFLAQQAQLGIISNALQIDLVDLQLKNAVLPDGIDQRFHSSLGNPQLIKCIKMGAEIFQWKEKKKKEKPKLPWRHGIGMAIGCHGNGVFGAHRDYISLILKLNEDGSLTLLSGVHDMGNGSITMQTQMIAEVLGIVPQQIETLEADTDACPWNLGDYASRGVYVEGNAAKKVAELLLLEMKQCASEILQCEESCLAHHNGTIFCKNHPENQRSFSEIAVYSQKIKQKEIIAVYHHSSKASVSSYGAHFVELLVNEDAKEIKILDYVAVHDVGKVVNPMGLEGQLHGGIQMGMGYALCEEYLFDENGKMLNSEFSGYRMLKSDDMPPIRIDFVDADEPSGPFGGKSIGECAVVPSAPAILNAVFDATKREMHSLPIQFSMIHNKKE